MSVSLQLQTENGNGPSAAGVSESRDTMEISDTLKGLGRCGEAGILGRGRDTVQVVGHCGEVGALEKPGHRREAWELLRGWDTVERLRHCREA